MNKPKTFLVNLVGQTGTEYGCYFECETREQYEEFCEDCGIDDVGELVEVVGQEYH